MVTSLILVVYLGRGQSLRGDSMEYASRLSEQPLGHALLHPPPGKYLIALPLLVYRGLLGVFGSDSEIPFGLVAITLVLGCAGLFFLLARRRVGDLWALPPTVLLLFFGYGGEVVLTGERIPELMAVASGLGMLVTLTRDSRRYDVTAAALLTVSLASHPSGLAFVAAATVLVLLRSSPARWRSTWIFLVPVGLYAAWWVFLRAPGTLPMHTRPSELATFVGQSWTATTAAVSGLAGVIDGSAYRNPLGWLAAALLFAIVAAGVATRTRRLPPSFWAAAAALLTLWVVTGLGRRGTELAVLIARPADAPRYLYPAAILLLLMLVELAGKVRLPAWGAWAATGVLTLGLVANLARLHDAANQLRLNSEVARASVSAVEIAARVVQPSYRPLGFSYPTAGEYLDAARAFGSPAYSPAELAARSPRTRLRADIVLIQAMRLSVRTTRSKSSSSGAPPRVDTAVQGTSKTLGACVELRPAHGADSLASRPSVLPPPPIKDSTMAPALAVVALPPGGASIAARRIAGVGLRLGRFADTPAVPLTMPRVGPAAALAVPEDNVQLPWKLAVYSREPVSLCGR